MYWALLQVGAEVLLIGEGVEEEEVEATRGEVEVTKGEEEVTGVGSMTTGEGSMTTEEAIIPVEVSWWQYSYIIDYLFFYHIP